MINNLHLVTFNDLYDVSMGESSNHGWGVGGGGGQVQLDCSRELLYLEFVLNYSRN